MNASQEPKDEETKQQAEMVAKVRVLTTYMDRRTAAMDFYLASKRGMVAVASRSPGGQATLDLRTKSIAVVAAEEIDADFPTLNAQLLVQTCSNAETLCHDFLRACLRHDHTLIHKEPFSTKVKFTMPELLSMTEDERADALAASYLEQQGIPKRNGVERFHEVFSFVGFNFSIEKEWRTPLRELYAIRNLILHHNGTVDRQFLKLCPWRKEESGSTLRVSSKSLAGYLYAMRCYTDSFQRIVLDRIKPQLDKWLRESEEQERRAREEIQSREEMNARLQEQREAAQARLREQRAASRKRRRKSRAKQTVAK